MTRARGGPFRRPTWEAWRARCRVLRHGLGRAWRRSSLRVAGVAGIAGVLAVVTYAAFEGAFSFLHGLEVVGPLLVVRLLSLFFFLLFVMLVLSNALVAFQTLYRSRESDFWAMAPVPAVTTFDARSLEMALIASWAFLVLGTPLLLGFGAATRAAPLFYVLVPITLVLFVVIAHALGALAVVVIVRAFPGLDMKRLVIGVVAALVPVAFVLARAFRFGGGEPDTEQLLLHAIEGLGRTQLPHLPGSWASEALRAGAAGRYARAAVFTWTLAISALFLMSLAREAASRFLLPGFQLMRGRGLRPALPRTRRRRGGPSRGPLRALARKDVALFFREPAQWSQAGLVALLAAVYVLNLRGLPDLAQFQLWGNVAAHLNLFILMLLTATLTTRFAFPLLSLEGRRSWVVLLAPVPRAALVREKFLLALGVALCFGQAAATFSLAVLGPPEHVRWWTHATVAGASVALSGLAVGLGAIFPDLREDNPARIVSGFGGTLDFLLGLAYVSAVTALVGAPSVLEAIGRLDAAARARAEIAGGAAALALTLAVAALPLALGRRRFARLEL